MEAENELVVYFAACDAQERELREAAKWPALVAKAKACAIVEKWHMLSTIERLLTEADVLRRVAEEAVGEAFEDKSR